MVIPLGIAVSNTHGYVSVTWITAGYALQGTGELFLGPIGYAMVGQLAPPRLRGVMMGTWMMTSGMGGAITGVMSKWATYSSTGDLSPLATNHTYARVFILLGLASVSVAVILFRLRPLLDRLIREPGVKVSEEVLAASKAEMVASS